MYITVSRDDTGRLVIHGQPHPDIPGTGPAIPDGITVRLCPPAACDRWSGNLAHPYQHTNVTAELAELPTSPPRDETVADLNAATAAVAIHPLSHRMLAVGPFTGPDRARQWWHADPNRFAENGATCHILPLTDSDAQTGAQA